MKITFLGAVKAVTGSCFLVETRNSKFIVDCGLFQGYKVDEKNNAEDFAFNIKELDFVILTHAHIDHSGRLPKLYKDGYRGRIISTKATADLCEIMLPDSGHIQEAEAEWSNRKRARAGKKPLPPIYSVEDATNCTRLFERHRYYETIILNDEIRLRFCDAGHTLGSSILEIWIKEGATETKLVFSGDLGNKNMPILRDPDIIEEADYLIMESTYGNRLHKQSAVCVKEIIDTIIETVDKGGNAVIPSFAVGRTQELIYELNKHIGQYSYELKRILEIPVYIDSPLAISATDVFRNNLDCFDEEAKEYIANGDNPLDFPGLRFSKTAEDSKMLNSLKESAVIISASGMCDAGRVRHHLKHNLWRPESSVIFVGYQAPGTLGRRIVDGAKKVKIFGEDIIVRAKIQCFDGFSGHADMNGLLDWLSSFRRGPQKIFLVHGEAESIENLSKEINKQLGLQTIAPKFQEEFILSAGKKERKGAIPQAESRTAARENKLKRENMISEINVLSAEFEAVSKALMQEISGSTERESLEDLETRLNRIKAALKENAV